MARFESLRTEARELPAVQVTRHLIAFVTAVLIPASGAFAQPILLPGHSGLPNGIPNPCVVPSVTSVQSGPWNQPSTWSINRVPASGDRVFVSPGTLVQYSTISDEKPSCIAIGGAVQFSTTTSTRLRVGTLVVLETGSLEIGTETEPVPVGVTAELFLAGLPLDPSADPEQFWGGLIGIGRVTMHGAVMDPTFVRLLAEPLAGQTSLTVSAPLTGWRVGDEVVIPDTRQLGATERFGSLVSQSERARIAAINGQDLLLDRRLAYAHQGARNFTGAIELLPHIGNVSRNVTIRSDAPAGVRGHTLYTHHAQVDIRFVEFRDLGRTRVDTGQIGRYPIHLHHLMGPHNPSNTGYQFRLIGNAVIDGYLWPLTVHNTHYGLIRDNVVAFGEGAGYVAEDGNESENEWVHNFGMAIRGDVSPRSLNGRSGSVFWWQGFNHIVTDNVASSGYHASQDLVAGAGFDFAWTPASSATTRIPLFRGADIGMTGQYQVVNMQHLPVRQFERNEAYGAMGTGLVTWYLGTDGYGYNENQPETVIRDFTGWHLWETGFFAYPTHHVTFDGFVIRNDVSVSGSTGWAAGDYKARDITIRRFDIQGTRDAGVNVSTGSEGYFRIEYGSLVTAAAGVRVPRQTTYGTQALVRPRFVEIRNVTFASWPGLGGTFLVKNWTGSNQPPTLVDEARVYELNGVLTDNLQWYYTEQGTQNVAGGPAPCSATLAGIQGLVCPIAWAPPPAPAPAPPVVPTPSPGPVPSPGPAPPPEGPAPSPSPGRDRPTSVLAPPPETWALSPSPGMSSPHRTTSVTVASVAQLHAAVDALTSGTTIVVQPGVYWLSRDLRIGNGVTNIAVQGATGNRDDVVILGSGMGVKGVDVAFRIEDAQDIRIAGLSLGQLDAHAILIHGEAGADRVQVRNVRLFDVGQQFIRSTVNSQLPNGADDVLVEGSLIEYTTSGPRNRAVAGIEVSYGAGWTVRRNVFRNIGGPAILMESGSSGTIVERNSFVDCERAVMFGLGPQAGYSHSHHGGEIVNNFVYRTQRVNADVGIGVWDSPGTRVSHNTVIQNGTYANAIEYRYTSSTGVRIINNLTDGAIVERDGAQAMTVGNYTQAGSALFVNAAAGDFHLVSTATAAIDRGLLLEDVTVDWDGQRRPNGLSPDIGADELGDGRN
jgi:hypothetical protein